MIIKNAYHFFYDVGVVRAKKVGDVYRWACCVEANQIAESKTFDNVRGAYNYAKQLSLKLGLPFVGYRNPLTDPLPTGGYPLYYFETLGDLS